MAAVTLRVDHPRRPALYKHLRRALTGLLALGLLGLLGGVGSLEESVWPLLAALAGEGLVLATLVYVHRLQRRYESAYLNLDDLGLSVGGTEGVTRLAWDELAAVEVVRLGSRLELRPRAGAPRCFPLAAWMRRQDEAGEGRLTPEELVALLAARVAVEGERPVGGPEPAGAGLWRVVDALLLGLAAALLLLHGLAEVLGIAPGAGLARAGLGAFGLLGALLALRGLALPAAATALGCWRGRAARVLGLAGLGAALAAALLIACL
ncbi:MAG TPA: hypothetical protein PK668_16645 [Myxococcota bacterium]|nr:hypothetical protein [Myxococcota bacterium]HRY94787.1 hypothetical protein [Myxococcota bacterium]HSA24329.1 hypothetical protein [Myxococcota bacterium]